RLVFNFESPLLGKFCNRSEIIRSSLDLWIILNWLSRDHNRGVNRVARRPRRTLEDCQQRLRLCGAFVFGLRRTCRRRALVSSFFLHVGGAIHPAKRNFVAEAKERTSERTIHHRPAGLRLTSACVWFG